jgi:hypothetical protein
MVVPKRPVVTDPNQNHACQWVCNYTDVAKERKREADIEYWRFQVPLFIALQLSINILFYFCPHQCGIYIS